MNILTCECGSPVGVDDDTGKLLRHDCKGATALAQYDRFVPDDLVIEVRRCQIVVYLSDEGLECVEWLWSGEEVTLMQAIGHIETCKLGIYRQQLRDFDGDDDE